MRRCTFNLLAIVSYLHFDINIYGLSFFFKIENSAHILYGECVFDGHVTQSIEHNVICTCFFETKVRCMARVPL